MLVGVTRRRPGAQHQPAQVDLVAVAQATMRKGTIPGRRRQHDRVIGGGELHRAGEEVGVQVGVGGVRDCEPASGRQLADRSQVACGVDRQGSAITEVDQVGTIAKAHVDQGLDRHPARLLTCDLTTGSRAAAHSGKPSSNRDALTPRRASSRTASSAYTQYGPRQ